MTAREEKGADVLFYERLKAWAFVEPGRKVIAAFDAAETETDGHHFGVAITGAMSDREMLTALWAIAKTVTEEVPHPAFCAAVKLMEIALDQNLRTFTREHFRRDLGSDDGA
ncbi:MAG: hypothetical protein KGL35_30495 [Bradyrhizobium sp.]|nr:hypothetical protein [Bradyrhizobium sp.]